MLAARPFGCDVAWVFGFVCALSVLLWFGIRSRWKYEKQYHQTT